MPYDMLGDEELVTLLTLGEKEALASLYSRHVKAGYSLVLHLLQDTGRAEVTIPIYSSWRSRNCNSCSKGICHLSLWDSIDNFWNLWIKVSISRKSIKFY